MERLTDRSSLNLRHGISVEDSSSAPASLFLSRLLEQGLRQVRLDEWATVAESLSALESPLLRVSAQGRDVALVELNGALVDVGLFNGRVYVEAAANDERSVDEALRELRAKLPAADPSATQEVTVTFWTYGPQGPQASSRSIAVPAWDDIEGNHSADTHSKLDAMMRGFQPAHGGQLLLWHGKPGTGKTFALRALAWEWRKWCPAALHRRSRLVLRRARRLHDERAPARALPGCAVRARVPLGAGTRCHRGRAKW